MVQPEGSSAVDPTVARVARSLQRCDVVVRALAAVAASAVVACGGTRPVSDQRAPTIATSPVVDAGAADAMMSDVAPVDGGARRNAGPRIDATGIDPNACPIVALSAKAAPAIATVRSYESLRRFLVRGTQPDTEAPDLSALGTPPQALFVIVHAGNFKDSTSTMRRHHAVFVLEKSYVVTGPLVTTNTMIPPPCGEEVQSAVFTPSFVRGANGRMYGHVRVRRRDVEDAPTLPAILASPSAASDPGDRCESLVTFRLEDTFIDLATGTVAGAVAQTYRGPLYEMVSPPSIESERLSITKQGIAVADPRCAAVFPLRR